MEAVGKEDAILRSFLTILSASLASPHLFSSTPPHFFQRHGGGEDL